MAIINIFFSSTPEKSGHFSPPTTSRTFFSTKITATMPLMDWHRNVAHATPGTPMWKSRTKRISTKIFIIEDTARK